MAHPNFAPGQSGPPSIAPVPAPPGAAAGADSSSPRLSADGRWLAFVSAADNLVTNAGNGPHLDVFVRDLHLQVTTLVSVTTNGAASGNGNSTHPVLSADGHYVVFESTAANLVAGDTNSQSDIFLRDLTAGLTTLVGTGGLARFTQPSLSPDGRWVAFERTVGMAPDVFVRQLPSGATLRANEGLAANPINPRSDSASMSDDGQRI